MSALRATWDLKIEPYFTYTPTGITPNSFTPTAGLSMKLNF